MATITRFEDIEAWKTARQLTNRVYDLTDQGAFARDYGLKNQIQRAAVSVMSNIAEGFESRTQALFTDVLGERQPSFCLCEEWLCDNCALVIECGPAVTTSLKSIGTTKQSPSCMGRSRS